MNDSKKAPASAATLTGAVETGAPAKMATTSTSNDITPATERQPRRIADLLLRGEQNALPMKHLKELTGMDSRKIRLIIQSERLSGTPIRANNRSGYYLPGSDLERVQCVKSMRHRSAEIARTADAIERGGDGA